MLHKADPEIAYMEKTKKWLIVKVHNAALGCYMSEGALVVVE